MAASKNPPVTTPLHLLQQLSQSLLEHLEEACSQALVDAEKLLAKLEKQRSKAQDKLHKASARLEEAAAAGKSKAQAKARTSIALRGSLGVAVPTAWTIWARLRVSDGSRTAGLPTPTNPSKAKPWGVCRVFTEAQSWANTPSST